ncbi:hypothetical protein PFICI_12143 [Pestalotiopsis fici W106-1]|uniref:Heterokaryon incompatibility domain-containing protein n=1 Tax=Pestalotiopsis fici (strain W106-1 / CGMCC3.15140) TaxID=1229662 RepID=W3WV90_PESFW|nr:uncharacterized protein PFICI_12143 [Pestalotiopsis fici W106-1]ETS76756.1 hypothetical protein PFICI_12143 [Pestalotiopsis fici W106-1]
MRLLSLQDGRLSLTKFNKHIPSYAILSHTWGAAEDEVTFEDVSRNEARNKKGYDKIKFCAEQAAIHNLEFFWVDTCCINKTDVQEFQNAINSMYRWYQNAKVCFVYMADLSTEGTRQTHQDSAWKVRFRQNRWFTRSWTLQELLAPREIKFYSNDNQFIGDKGSLVQELEAITRIPASTLLGADSAPFSLEECIFWAGDRESTYEEDKAYSLLGLCGVSLAPNYGEGVEDAFERLRKRCHKKRNKQGTIQVYESGGKDNWHYDSQAHEALQLSRVAEISPFAQSHPNNFEETETGPLNKTTRRLVDIKRDMERASQQRDEENMREIEREREQKTREINMIQKQQMDWKVRNEELHKQVYGDMEKRMQKQAEEHQAEISRLQERMEAMSASTSSPASNSVALVTQPREEEDSSESSGSSSDSQAEQRRREDRRRREQQQQQLRQELDYRIAIELDYQRRFNDPYFLEARMAPVRWNRGPCNDPFCDICRF